MAISHEALRPRIGVEVHRLQEWASRPEFVYRHAWNPGDVVMWDNRGTMHRACAYEPTARRIMRRVELAGEEAIV